MWVSWRWNIFHCQCLLPVYTLSLILCVPMLLSLRKKKISPQFRLKEFTFSSIYATLKPKPRFSKIQNLKKKISSEVITYQLQAQNKLMKKFLYVVLMHVILCSREVSSLHLDLPFSFSFFFGLFHKVFTCLACRVHLSISLGTRIHLEI